MNTKPPSIRLWAGARFLDHANIDGWRWLVLAVGISFVLRVPLLAMPMISDEGGYAYVAQRWLAGEGRLYHDLWVSRPQGIFVAYGLIFESLGTSVEALRVGAWLASAATLGFVWLFARDWAGPRLAGRAALLFAVLNGLPTIEGYTANAEVFLALPAAALAWLLLRASRRDWHCSALVAVGVCAGLATLLKPSGLVMLPTALVFLWLVGRGAGAPMVRRTLAIGTGFVIAIMPALVHGWLVGWQAFVFAAVTYRMRHQSSATASLPHHLHALFELVARSWLLLLFVCVVLLVRDVRRPKRESTRQGLARKWAASARPGIVARSALPVRTMVVDRVDAGGILLRLWLLGSLVGVAMGGDWWPHYLIQAVAPFAIWFAPVLRDAVAGLTGRRRRLLIGFVLAALLAPYWVVVLRDPGRMSQRLFTHPGYPMQHEVAAYLRRHTPADATIYVAFDQAALYYLADRRAAYRYLYDQELLALPESERELIDLVDGPHRPLYIVGTRQRAPFADRGQPFWNAVSEHYRLETTVRGAPVYRAIETPEHRPFRSSATAG